MILQFEVISLITPQEIIHHFRKLKVRMAIILNIRFLRLMTWYTFDILFLDVAVIEGNRLF